MVVAILLALALTGVAQAQEKPADGDRIEIKQLEDTVEVLIDGELFTRLNYKDASKPYLFPIVGPTGASMTRSFPMVDGVAGESKDHPHHTGMWFAHGNINGIDYWHSGGERGHTKVVVEPELGERSFTFISALAPAGDIQRQQGGLLTGLGFEVDADGTRNIDYRLAFLPIGRADPFVFGDTKEGTMAIRLHPALRLKGPVATGHCINSEGDTDAKAWGKRAKWVAYWGQIDGKTVGVAMFDHPTNLRHPTWWHARDYGLLAANPFGIHDFEKGQPAGTGDYSVPKGEVLEMTYRFVFFVGTAEEADIAGKYDAWVAETTEQEDNEEE